MICKFKYTTGFYIYHGCETFQGSSGSPILKVVNGNLRVVALHRGGVTANLKYGTDFKAVLHHTKLVDGEGNWLQIF